MNRREALVSIAAATVVAPAVATGTAPDRFQWNLAWADYEKAQREAEEAHRLYDCAYTRYEALAPSIDMIDTKNLPSPFVHRAELETLLDTAKTWAWVLANEGKTWSARDPEAYKANVKAALDSVDSYRMQRDHARKVTKLDYYSDLSDTADDRVSEAEQRLLDLPAPDGAALLWKVNRLYAPGEGIWSEGIEDQTHSDLHRLLGSMA